MKNKKYNTNEIQKFYSNNRNKWSQLYKSEREILKKLKIKKDSKVLDIGSACGGLGKILGQKYKIKNYVGLEINKEASIYSKKIFKKGIYQNIDLLNYEKKKSFLSQYDFVFSLGCVDWNTELDKMLVKAWMHVKIGGYLILTLRFVNIQNIKPSFQYINFNKSKKGEKAKYHILNFKKFKSKIKNFKVKNFISYGYWAKPNITTVTEYKKIFFAGLAIQKDEKNSIIISKFF